MSVLEGSHNFPIDITQNPTAFPTETVSFSWTRNGQPLTTDPAQTYSSLTFSSVDRSDSGNYSVFATNVVEGREVGNDTGSFYLNVICKLCIHIVTHTIPIYHVCTISSIFVTCVCVYTSVCLCAYICTCVSAACVQYILCHSMSLCMCVMYKEVILCNVYSFIILF